MEGVSSSVDERDRKVLDEIRADVKLLLQLVPTFVTWKKLGGLMATVAGLVIAAIKLF